MVILLADSCSIPSHGSGRKPELAGSLHRPRFHNMVSHKPSTPYVSLLPNELADKLETAAKDRNTSRSAIIREALELYFTVADTCEAAAL